MCGRAACTLAPAHIEERYKPKNGFRNVEDYHPSPNIAPFGRAYLPVLSAQQDDASKEVTTDVAAMRWGLIPFWQKDDQANNADPKSFNARTGINLSSIRSCTAHLITFFPSSYPWF
jgi:putative SOS response-associated peptidase YedK